MVKSNHIYDVSCWRSTRYFFEAEPQIGPPAAGMPSPSAASALASRHLRLWCRRRGRSGAVAATFAVALLAAALLLSLSYYASLPLAPASASRSSALVGLTLLRRADEKGAREYSSITSLLFPVHFSYRSTARYCLSQLVYWYGSCFTGNYQCLVWIVLCGAVCLDGSAPGYHLQRGSGSGSQSWLIHLEVRTFLDLVHNHPFSNRNLMFISAELSSLDNACFLD
jgi:hypothetical protein